jgi:hypothetical protein
MFTLTDADLNQEYLGVPPPTSEEQSSLYLPILTRRAKKPLNQNSLRPTAMVVRTTLDEDDTVSYSLLYFCLVSRVSSLLSRSIKIIVSRMMFLTW